ncbi:HAD family hydrolase [Candidatus Haliotispira prima]|uniref:HAD family hydrolase n=1 Tax=Candidatus Haliotispira prima TaxID=3034016 RepID=A0ABY8MDV6_9SPIO|nr:HAD family hydrolase [Candidatus Haliotispira prima]
MPKVKAVAFDIDGTLYPQWHLLTTSLGLYIRNFRLVQSYWKVRRNLREDGYHYQAEGREGLLHHQAQMYADLTGEQVADVRELLEYKIYQVWERTFRHLKPLPGVKKVLKELRNRGFTVAAMSDFPVEKKLEYFDLGVEEYWDLAITSEDSGHLKPHGMAYQYLSQKLNLEPEEILYVGNSYRNDIEGAKKAGCWAAYFTWKNRRDSLADFHYRNYQQFLDRFDQFVKY